MEIRYLREKIIISLCVIILFTSCESSKEKDNKEYQKVKKELDSLDNLILQRENLEIVKRKFEDSLKALFIPYNEETEGWELKINDKQEDYFQELGKIKDYYYSRYGHNPNYQTQMDEAMQKAEAKNQKSVAPYRAKIAEIKKRLDGDERFQRISKDLDSVSTVISKTSNHSNPDYHKKKIELNKKLKELEKKLKK